MKRRTLRYVATSMLILLTLLFAHLNADGENGSASTITLDWQEFHDLLKLDTDEVRLSWGEFSKLLEQTGFVVQPEYRMEGGDVILAREQFSALIDRLKPPKAADLAPPGDYIMRKARYEGRVGEKSTRFTAHLDLQILKDTETYLKIPLFSEELAIEEVRLDNGPASIITESGYHFLLTTEAGSHEVAITFSVASSLDEGTPGFRFRIPQTPITEVTLDIPRAPLDLEVAHVQELQVRRTGDHTLATCHLVPSQEVNITWVKRVAEERKGPAKVYAEVHNLLSIEAAAIRVTTMAKLDILQNKSSTITFEVPGDYQVIEVQGPGNITWNVRETADRQLLDVAFEYPLEGTHLLTIKTEKLLDRETTVVTFSGIAVLGVVRESGFVAGEVRSDAEAHIQEFTGLDRVDFQRIPELLSSRTNRPIQFAYKYTRHPYDLVVSIVKYEKEEALSGIIDNASGITFISEEGKLVHQVTFTVQNMWNQFLKIELPEYASIWSVYVDGNREKPSRDSDGKILIPLPRSRKEGNELSPFEVELVYSEPLDKFSLLGRHTFSFPAPDFIMNRMEWQFYVPEYYRYFHFTGNLNAVETFPETDENAPETGAMPSTGPTDPVAKKAAPSSRRENIDLLKGAAGLRYIRVTIPLSGNTILFTKQFVERGEQLHVTFSHMDGRLITYLIALAILVFLIILVKFRGKFTAPLQRMVPRCRRYVPFLKRWLHPKVLILLFIIAVGLSLFSELYLDFPVLFWLLMLGFIASLAQVIRAYTMRDMKPPWHPIVVLVLLFLMLPLGALCIFRTWAFLTLGLAIALLGMAFLLLLIRTLQGTMQAGGEPAKRHRE